MPSLLNTSCERPRRDQTHTHLFAQHHFHLAIGSVNSAWGSTDFMLVFCGMLSSICSPMHIFISVKANTVPRVKSQPDNLHGSGEEHFGILFLSP